MRHILVVTLVILVLLLPACTRTYTLSTSVSPSGSGSVSHFGGSYKAGSTVTVTAQRAYGYVFDHWGGDASGTSPTITITMDSDKSIIAYFIKECHEEVIGTTYDRMLAYASYWYDWEKRRGKNLYEKLLSTEYVCWDGYIQKGRNVSLSWKADGTLDAYIFTQAQFKSFNVSVDEKGMVRGNALASGYVARRNGYNGTISAEIKTSGWYYFVLCNPDYFATRKVNFAEAKVTCPRMEPWMLIFLQKLNLIILMSVMLV